MQLQVTKLGGIEEFTFDIRPLTVFFGPNGTNKTWVNTLLGALLRERAEPRLGWSVGENPVANAVRGAIDNLVSRAASGEVDRAEIELDLADLHGSKSFEARNMFEEETAAGILGLAPGTLPGARIALTATSDEARRPLPKFRVAWGPKERALEIVRERGVDQRRTITTGAFTPETLFERLFPLAFSIFERVVSLPADRGGLTTTLPALDPERRRNLPPVAQWFLEDLERLIASPRSALLHNSFGLLDPLLGGHVQASEGPVQRLLLERPGGIALPIEGASSLSRTNASLALWAEKWAQVDDILLVDELELNAHPAAQLALVEQVAVWVNAGIRVVFTTHSPYVLDHLNALLEATRVSEERIEHVVKGLKLHRKDALLKSETVSAYCFDPEDGGRVRVRDAIDVETGLIDTKTFASVSRGADRLFAEILEAEDHQ